MCQCLGHRGVRTQHDDIGGHQCTRRTRLIRQQLAHDGGFVFVHLVQDSRALFARHLGQQVGQVVVFHLVENVQEAFHVEAFDQTQLFGLGKFFQQVGKAFVVHGLGQLAALQQRQRTHDTRHVAGVHVAQTRGFGSGLGGGGEQCRHCVPVDEAIRRPATQRVAPRQANLGDFPSSAAAVFASAQGHVGHHFVSHLLVDDVGAQQALAFLGLERVEVDVPTAQAGARIVEGRHTVGVHEDAAALAAGNKAQHPRGGGRTA